jgi:hypothetical protein
MPFYATDLAYVHHVVETSLEVHAPSSGKAKDSTLVLLKTQPFDGSKAIIRNEVIAVD